MSFFDLLIHIRHGLLKQVDVVILLHKRQKLRRILGT